MVQNFFDQVRLTADCWENLVNVVLLYVVGQQVYLEMQNVFLGVVVLVELGVEP